MENASKALLIAGGVLIGILVVSVLVLAFNQMSEYQSSSSNLEKSNQLSQFNAQFVQYAKPNLKGTELITLLNRVVSYNRKEIGAGEIDYSQTITIKVSVHGFNEKYGNSGKTFLFGNNDNRTFTITTGNDELMQIINGQRDLESMYGLNALSMLTSNMESLKSYYNPQGSNDSERQRDKSTGRTIKQVIGKNLPELEQQFNAHNFSAIDRHGEYANFKTSKFRNIGEILYADNGQVTKMDFEFVE